MDPLFAFISCMKCKDSAEDFGNEVRKKIIQFPFNK